MNKLFISVAFLAMSLVACNNSQPEKSADSSVKNETSEVGTKAEVETNAEVKNNAEAQKESQETAAEKNAVESNEPSTYEKLTKGNIKVKGAADIEGFCRAILPVANPYYSYSENLEEIKEGINKKAGYWSSFSEGDGYYKAECCYWSRNDKKKLVAYSENENYNNGNDTFTLKTCLCFFLYNEATKELEPIEAPFNGTINLKDGEHLLASLPEKGKDIEYYISKKLSFEGNPKILKWNGMGFDVK